MALYPELVIFYIWTIIIFFYQIVIERVQAIIPVITGY